MVSQATSAHQTTSMLVAGHFDRDASYRNRRPTGTDDWLLIYTRAGQGILKNKGNDRLTVPGDLILYDPNRPQAYDTDPKHGRWELFWAHFRPPATWTPYLDWPQESPGPYRVHLDHSADRQAVERSLLSMLEHQSSGRPLALALAMNALEAALLHASGTLDRGGSSLTPDDPLHPALHAMHARLTYAWTVDELAALTPWSASRFSHRFSECLGVPPMSYLADLRVRRAMQLLEHTGLSIGQVAAEVGFDNPFYFSRRFRAIAGTSPSAYRQTCLNRPNP